MNRHSIPTHERRGLLRFALVLIFAALLGTAGPGLAASVGPSGYTNDFSAQPPAADWATVSIAGTPGETYDLDTDIATNLNVAVATISFQVVSNVNNPASQLTNATWSSAGLYLQTRPNNNRYTILLGKFVNNTGSNATQVAVSYQLTMTGTAVAEDAGKGTHVFYSLSGAAGSWLALPSLNILTNAGSYLMSTNLAVNWVQGAGLYLLWADDNGTTGTDTPNQIDNFSLRVTAAAALSLACTLDAPANSTLIVSGNVITARATPSFGTPPYLIEYFTSSGAGNTSFTSAGSSGTAPYNLNLSALTAGSYNLYAVVTDSAGGPATAQSLTNTFVVADPITFTLVTPTNNATFDNTTGVMGQTTVAGGTAPYAVQFSLDGATDGAAVTMPPYSRNFGALGIGDHTISAAVTDGRGWVSNSLVSTVHINGPLSVALTPTNGTTLTLGASLTLTAAVLGGTSPYAVEFYTNGVLAATVGTAPFRTNLGALAVGIYNCYARALDAAAGAAFSTTNVITITPPALLATLTAPTAGQIVTVGQPFTLAATATVGAPLTVSNVEFFVDGASAGLDGTSPYAATNTPALGSHTAFALATDSLGRKTYTATNSFTAVAAITAAIVGPTGYTNDFSTQPLAVEWSTLSIAGAAGDAYTLDTDVNLNISIANTTARTTASAGDPPTQLATAVWSSTAFYLQTRPTGNRYNVLMGRFLNQTGTNATQIGISYLFTQAAAGATEEIGIHAYYSYTGATGTWVNIPGLNSTAFAAGSAILATNVDVVWTNGGNLYLLWADDNAQGAGLAGTDSADEYDNFSLTVTAGLPPSFAAKVTAPTNSQLYVSGTPITAAASLASGTGPYTVEYFTNSGAGNTVFASAGTSGSSPFSVALGALPAGDYNLYAAAADSGGLSTNSVTNSFRVADPIVFALTAPTDNFTTDNLTPVTGMTTVGGGTPPYSVRFFLDNSPSGAAITSAPYQHGFGALVAGDHTIRAAVTDARGWVSNSLVSTVHITGPLGATFTPPDGTAYNYGSSISVTGTLGGGSAPYAADFYVNDLLAGSVPAAPFILNLGVLPAGSYTGYVHATDSSLPTAQQANSATNLFTVVPNPIVVVLTTATNGTAGTSFALAATATVSAPLTISNVEFFYDSGSAGVDGSAPYTGSVASPTAGSHAFYAVATDNLGRKGYSTTNTATFVTDPLANNNFANRFTLPTPASVTGANAGAGTESGEPTFAANPGGGFSQWGATLWWKWIAPVTSTVTIDTIGSSFNTYLSVYTGSAVNALTVVAQNNDAPGLANVSLVSFTAQQGTEYEIQVGGIRSGFGGGATTATGNIQLNLSVPAVVAITSPTNGGVFLAGSNIAVSATATSTASTITKVDLYDGATFVGTSSNGPAYSFVISNAPPGSNSLYAVATDSLSQIVTSGVVRVLVANYGITITSPNEDSVYPGSNPITAAVFTLLPAGSITNVNFFVDGQPIGSDATAPFSLAWSNVTGGSHRLTATGLDDSGNSYTATPVNFGVASLLVHSNAVWKYLADGSDQGTNWQAPGFDDSTWLSGPAELGYGDADEATIVPSGPAGAFYVTTYFRRAFTVTNAASFTNLNLLIAYDDAGVVYLNGREVYRAGSLPAVVLYNSLTTGAAIEETVNTTTISATNLVEGVNELAVEIHQQSVTSSDISFFLQLVGVPRVSHNIPPLVAIYDPTNSTEFYAPPFIFINATATDPDGSVAKVEFFVDGVKLGDGGPGAPGTDLYHAAWNNPPIGAHVLTAVATDNQGAKTTSAGVPIVIFDAVGTPVAAITSPADGAVMEGPTNLLITATAHAPSGVTNVQFLANGVAFANDSAPPYTALWSSSFLSNGLQAVAFDVNGVRGTSAVVSVTITIPPTNVIAPTIATQLPPAFATITNLTNITVTFSERVQNVDAADLLINGLPATGVTAAANGSNYTFSFRHPPYGHVDVSFASGHGITDFGYPGVLPFNEFGADAIWSYELLDRTPPRVLAHGPATGATVTNLSEIAVTFSEGVSGVDAADLLVGGVPAFALSGSGSNYVFQVSQPASGTISITWATNHGIFDFADIPNSFVRTATGNTWSFTLDSRTTFVASNSTWRFIKGLAEASDPTNAWRQLGFDDSSWSNSAAPFFFGDPYTNFPAGIVGTHLSDMRSNYSSLFLRKEFNVVNRSIITNLILNAQSDDGYIAWLNGVEVRRFNAPTGDITYASVASASATESASTATYVSAVLTNNPLAALVNGVNILAIQAFNVHVTNDDFGFNAQLYSFLPDTTTQPPRLAFASPLAGDVFYLTNIVMTFSEDVTNVDASDLLVNGVPATSVVAVSNAIYSFTFAQPPYGAVAVTWATNHGIVDLDPVPKPFDGAVASAKVNYLLINPSAPTVLAQTPPSATTITGLTSIAITFSEPVTGVDVSDLLINGVAATGFAALSETNYVFTFPQPAFGAVTVRFATNNGISDLEVPPSAFDRTRPANQWNYTLVNPVPTVTMTAPTNNTFLLAPANVALRATATDSDGTITLVEFFEGETKIAEAATSPYTNLLSDVPVGTYILRAVATDNSGLRGTSAPVVLNVVTQLPINLVRGPYLQAGSSTGGVVRWRTDQFSDGVVRYGTDFNQLTNVAVQATLTNNHIVALGGLQPETKYFYAFGSSGQTLAGGTNAGGSNYWFNTPPVPGTIKPARFWVLGDPGTANANQRAVRDSYYSLVANGGKPADFWLMLGDNAYNSGQDTEYQSAVFDMYPTTLRNYFLFPVLGNHETAQSTDTTIRYPYLDIFSTPQNGEAGGLPSGSPKYYSYNYANIHFVGLDSMTSGRETNSPMLLWLKDDLASTTQTWTIVYFHHSLYTKGTHNSDTEADLIQMRQNFNPILEAAGVDLVLMGHSHVYERSYLLDGHYGLSTTLTPSMKIDGGDGREDGNGAYRKNADERGVVYSIVGCSGQALGGTLNHPAHVVSLNLLGSLLVDVSSNRLDAMFLTSTGTTNDHYTLLKRSLTPDAPSNVLARATGPDQIEIDWTDLANNELGYYLERSLDGTLFLRLATNGPNTSSYLDTGLTPGQTYYYRVIAYNGAGLSGSSTASDFIGNHTPALAAIPDVVRGVLQPLAFAAVATDPDVPKNLLTYSLDAGAPATAFINASNGLFRWQPARTDAATTNIITARVTDNGVPPLNGARSFTVVVPDYLELSLGSAVLDVGQSTNVLIESVATAPLSNLSFAVVLPAVRLTALSANNLIPAAAAATLDISQPGLAIFTFTALPGQSLNGAQQLARLHFTAALGQTSAFIPLNFTGVAAQRAQPGLAPTVLLNAGRVVAVNGQPLLEASRPPGGPRTLSLYGKPGTNYLIETSSVPVIPGSWHLWRSMLLTNLLETTGADAATNAPMIFYRTREQ